jgi:hypothetical protein
MPGSLAHRRRRISVARYRGEGARCETSAMWPTKGLCASGERADDEGDGLLGPLAVPT